MTRLEEEMHDAQSLCIHSEPGTPDICVQCAVKAAQSVQDDLLDRFKKRGAELLAVETERDQLRDIINQNAKQAAFAAGGQSVGLTKREHFAAMAMQGLLSSVGDQIDPLDVDIGVHAQAALRAADTLITYLNSPAEPDE